MSPLYLCNNKLVSFLISQGSGLRGLGVSSACCTTCCPVVCKCCQDGSYGSTLKATVSGLTVNQCATCSAANGDYLPEEGEMASGDCLRVTSDPNGFWPSSIYTAGDVFCRAGYTYGPTVSCLKDGVVYAFSTLLAYVFWNETKQIRGVYFYMRSLMIDYYGTYTYAHHTALVSESAADPYECDEISVGPVALSGTPYGCSGTLTVTLVIV